jgi:hypothetical protein
VGGTAIPFNGDAAYYDRYLASSKKWRMLPPLTALLF